MSVEGGINDAEFIMKFFQEKLEEFDFAKKNINCFFFESKVHVNTKRAILLSFCS